MFKRKERTPEQLEKIKKRKLRIYDIVFENDTPEGKAFDVALMICIVVSIFLVVAESTLHVDALGALILRILEYAFTAFFTIEYLLRLYCSPKPREYALSFFGIIDLLATLPLYIAWLFGPARYLMIIRTFRLIRVFRIFKLFSFLDEGYALIHALLDSMKKISVFFLFVLIMVISIGTLMFMIEGNVPESSFKDIPSSIYWAIVTLTTVGYGDITPVTSAGRFLSALVMLLGYTTIAVPTGIVSANLIKTKDSPYKRICENCGRTGHDANARYCKYCGTPLDVNPQDHD